MMDKNVANDDGDSSKLDVTTTAEHRKRNLRWQKIHVVFLMIAFLCSLAGILAFGLVVKNFEAFCPLFASNISVRLDDDGKAYVFDDWNSTWGSKATCDYCLFTTEEKNHGQNTDEHSARPCLFLLFPRPVQQSHVRSP